MAVIATGINQRFLRIYSGSGHYVNLFQVGQPDLPGMEPRPETATRADGGRATNFIASYIVDEMTPFEPVAMTFTVLSMSEYVDMQRAIGNWQRWATWTVGAHTWTPVLPANLGTRFNSAGVAASCIPPVDAIQLAYMVNIAWTESVPAGATTGAATFGEARGFVVSNVTASTEDNLNIYNVEGMIYGQIRWNLTAWPAGTESIPS
jgi:hypothetical protein